MSTSCSIRQTLDKSEIREIKDIMEKNSFSTLSSLYKKLTEIFRPEGVTELDTKAAYESGLYDLQGISEVNLDEIDDLLYKIEGTLLNNDIYVTPSSDDSATFIDTSRKTILGTPEFISQEEIEEEIISKVENPKNSSEVASLVNNLPYSSFAERFNSNESFRNQILKNVGMYTKIQTLFIKDGAPTDKNLTYFKNLQRTVGQNNDVIGLLADLEFLKGIDDNVWNESQEEIKEVLKEIEDSQFYDNGIDVFGLSNYSSNKELVISTVDSLGRMLENPTKENMFNFAENFTELVPQQESSFSEILPENLEPFSQNIFKVHSNLSESELFRDHGLIKIGDNLYHKVDLGNRSELYEQLYQTAQETGLPISINTEDKESSLRELEKYVMLQESTLDKDVRENHTLNKLIFNHPKVQDTNDYAQLSDITSDPEYLVRTFPRDFNDYIIVEKQKDSKIYRDTLSKFRVGESGIYLTSPVKSIDGIDFQRELEDYIRLSKDQSMKYLLPTRENNLIQDPDLEAINNPMSVSMYSRQYTVDNGLLVTESTPENNIRFFGKTYSKVAEDAKNSVFKQVPENPNANFYSINKDFITEEDRQIASKVLNDAKFSFVDPVVTKQDFDKSIENAGIKNEIKLLDKQPTLNSALSQSDSDLINELSKVNNITREQGLSLVNVTNRVYRNISERLGITIDKFKRNIAVKSVNNVKNFIENIPKNSIALKGLSSEIISDLSESKEDTTNIDFQDVNPKYIKNLGLKESDYILSNVLSQEDSFSFLGYSQKLSGLGNRANIEKEINRRLEDILERAKETVVFYIQELSPSFLNSQIERSQTELERDSIQAMLDGDQSLIQQNLENLQDQQKSNLLSSLNYIIPSNDYPAEFKYLMVGLVLKGNVAKDIEIKNNNNEVVRVIKGSKSKRTSSTVGNHQELSSMVMPSVFQEMQTSEGSSIHPMDLISKYTDKSYITREETWDIIKNRISKETQDGYWVKFQKSSNIEDIQALTLVSKKVAKVMDENPWCTGGGMANSYLPKGDFYLFLNNELEPKITVRYEGSNIRELKGTDKGQALTADQTRIAEDYLEELPNGQEYSKQVKVSKVYHMLKERFQPDYMGDIFEERYELNDYLDTYNVELETYDYSKTEEFIKLRSYAEGPAINSNKKFNLYTNILKSVSDSNINELEEGTLVLGRTDLEVYFDIPNNIVFNGTVRVPSFDLPSGFKLPDNCVFNGAVRFNDSVLPEGFMLPKNSTFNGGLYFVGTKFNQDFKLPEDTTFNCKLSFIDASLPLDFYIPSNSTFNKEVAFNEAYFPNGIRIGENSTFMDLLSFTGANLRGGFEIKDNVTFNSDVALDSALLPDELILPSSSKFNDTVDFRKAWMPKKSFKIEEGSVFNGMVDFSETDMTEGFEIPRGAIFNGAVFFDRTLFKSNLKISKDSVFNKSVYFEDAEFSDGIDIEDGVKINGSLNLVHSKIENSFKIPKNFVFNGITLTNSTLPENFKIEEGVVFKNLADFSRIKFGKGFEISPNTVFETDPYFGDSIFPDNFTIPDSVIFREGVSFFDAKTYDGSIHPISSFKPSILALSQDKRGAIVRTGESTLILLDKNNADVTSPIHELVHKYEEVLTPDEVKIVEGWSGYKSGTKDFSEAFAVGFEKYVYEGSELNSKIDNIFKKLKDWFLKVINDAKEYFGGINELTPAIKDIYSKILMDNKIENIQTLENLSDTPSLSYKQSATQLLKEEDVLSKLIGLKDSMSNAIAFPSVYTPINDTVESVAEELRACN